MFPLHVRKDTQYVPVTLVDNAGVLVTGAATVTVEITKNGASYAAPSDGAFTEIGNGDYYVSLDQTDTETLGFLILRIIRSGVIAESKTFCTVGIDAAAEASMAETIRRLIRMERLK